MTPLTLAYRRLMLYGSVAGTADGDATLFLEISDADLVRTIGLTALTTLVLLWVAQRAFARLSPRFADEL